MGATLPPGWPGDLVPPDDPDFERRAVGWLLDLCPPEYRSHEVFRRHPLVLAHVTAEHLGACLAGARTAYAGVRRDLGEHVDPPVIEATLRALEREGSRLAARDREVGLVAQALEGRRWTPRL